MYAFMRRWLPAFALACQLQSPAPSHISPDRERSPAPPAAPAGSPLPPTGEDTDSKKPGKALELDGKVVHPGCVLELTEAINSDIVVHSVNWSLPDAKGCDRSNRYSNAAYWQGGTLWFDQTPAGDRFGYQLYRALDERTYVLRTKTQTSGTFGMSSYLFVKVDDALEWAEYPSGPAKRKVTALTRLGEVHALADVEAIIRASQLK